MNIYKDTHDATSLQTISTYLEVERPKVVPESEPVGVLRAGLDKAHAREAVIEGLLLRQENVLHLWPRIVHNPGFNLVPIEFGFVVNLGPEAACKYLLGGITLQLLSDAVGLVHVQKVLHVCLYQALVVVDKIIDDWRSRSVSIGRLKVVVAPLDKVGLVKEWDAQFGPCLLRKLNVLSHAFVFVCALHV